MMSYNIDTVKVYEIDLKIRKADMKKLIDEAKKKKDWINFAIDLDGKWELHICEDTRISGTVEGEWLIFSDLGLNGEGSGSDWEDIIKPMLKYTRGNYKARFVWEGGDSITMVRCVDGNLSEEEME